jgi:hypothetical protein
MKSFLMTSAAVFVNFQHLDWRYVVTVYLPLVLTAAYVWLTFAISKYTMRAAKASEDSAKAAADSAKLTGESLTLVQRPYVVFDGLEEKEFPSPLNRDGEFRIHIKNVGSTPAFKGWFRTEIFLSELEYSNESLPTFKSKPLEDLVIPATGPLSVNEFFKISPSDFILYLERKKKLYIFGEFRYEDVFKVTHVTKFCLRYTPNGFNAMPFFNEMS